MCMVTRVTFQERDATYVSLPYLISHFIRVFKNVRHAKTIEFTELPIKFRM